MADLRNVSIDFYCTFNDESSIVEELKFGTLILNEANFSFESFSNGTKGVELICYSGRLLDCRFDDLAANKRGNVFPVIFCTSEADPGRVTGQTTNLNRIIAAELYFSSGLKEGSKFSVILTSAKITLVMDWLFMMRDFILFPHSSKSVLRVQTYNIKCGVATRKPYAEKVQENYEFKINISKSELIFVENSSCRHSLASVLTGSWIIYYPCNGLAPSFSCDSVQIFNCTMENRAETETVLTEPFSMTMENVAPEQQGKKLNVKLVPIGLIQVASEIREQKIE
uniref:Uncharacterized protein n=1 Tax=Romanomermis culicivorax TaxID=13658 RepID=A0A915HYC6_ROMCU